MTLKDAERKPLKSAQLRDLDDRELADELEKLKEARFRLRFRAATEQIDSPAQFRTLRRNIARIATVMREKRSAS